MRDDDDSDVSYRLTLPDFQYPKSKAISYTKRSRFEQKLHRNTNMARFRYKTQWLHDVESIS